MDSFNATTWYNGNAIFVFADEYMENMEKRRSMMRTKNGLCFCGSGKKQKECHSNIKYDSIIAHLILQMTEMDNDILKAHERNETNSFCKKGCNDCCGGYFYISMMEYFAIKANLLRNKRFEGVMRYAKKQMAQFKTEYPKEYEEMGSCSKIATGKDCFRDKLMQQDQYQQHINFFPIMQDGKSIRMPNGQMVLAQLRPMPLIYWFVEDDSISEKYIDAVTIPMMNYCKKNFTAQI